MIAADTVKQMLTMRQVSENYGYIPNRSGFIKCPFHEDKTASLKIYDTPGGGYYCFGCNSGGSIIDFVMHLFHLNSPLEAVKELNQVFRLGIDLEAPEDTREAVRALAARREREEYRVWRQAALLCLTGHYRHLWQLKLRFEPTDPEKEVPVPWAAAVRWLDYVEDCLDLLTFGEEQEVRQAKPVIDSLVGKIQKRSEAK